MGKFWQQLIVVKINPQDFVNSWNSERLRDYFFKLFRFYITNCILRAVRVRVHAHCTSRGESKTARIKRILNNFNYKLKQWFTAINILKMISKYVKDEVIFKNNNYNIIITIKNRLELFFTKNWQTNINGDEFFCILLNLAHLHKLLETAYIIRRSSQNRK